ncbi:4'-phosphopantetheinyl transferase family protein [Streptomyces sp. NRRL F-5650]|uniref:4'-phosphopantetheinyl transferase family protein n=1 Tax=Streptomyces sp. NRRL F-5650 TaxID=1463868 RepID=UPI00068E0732|nr:4'-phosphopantetheinyl transferase superfamily protein [Streptomyces sp. NRRL F-5650]
MTAPPIGIGAGECQVWTTTAETHLSLLDLLDDAERQRCRELTEARVRAQYMTAHAFVRRIVSSLTGADPRALRFERVCQRCGGPHGKPRLLWPGLEVSLSHSGERVAVAVSTAGPVGVDIQYLVTDGRARDSVLAEPERRTLLALPEERRAAAFTRYWARKEAVLKATGDGLTVDPADLTVSGPDEPARLLGWRGRPDAVPRIALTDLDTGPGHRLAVALWGPAGGARAPAAVHHHGITDLSALRTQPPPHT